MVILFALAGLVAFAERWISRYLITRQLTRERFDREDGRGSPRPRARRLPRRWQPSRATSACTERTSRSSAAGLPAADGRSRSTWRGERSRRAARSGLSRCHSRLRNFTSEIERDMTAFGLAGLTVENRLLVDGQNIRDDARFLPDPEGRPVTEIGALNCWQLTREPEPVNRPYQCIRAADLGRRSGSLRLRQLHQARHRAAGRGPALPAGAVAARIPASRPAGRLSLGQRLRTELRSAPVGGYRQR